MDSGKWLWPSGTMDFWKTENDDYKVTVKWSRNSFLDYKELSYKFYKCGFLVFENIIGSSNNHVKTDMWFLTGIFLLRHSMELGIKALLCRSCKKKSELQATFKECCHDLSALIKKYFLISNENYLSESERKWLVTYLASLESVDKKSDVFRFPFEDKFLSKYRDKFIDNVDVANNMLQASALIKKCIEYGSENGNNAFNSQLKPEFLIITSHGIGNCYLWRRVLDNGFYVKITGYMEVADYIFQNNNLSVDDKLYPLMFMLRNTLELCLKQLFYSQVDNGVPSHVFFSKKKSHLIKKDLWKNVKPMIVHYANEQNQDTDVIDIVEEQLNQIDKIDKNGDNFRYPTSYSLEYRFDCVTLNLKNVYEYMRTPINFLDSCGSMLNEIADYESEMRSYYNDYYNY